MFRSHRSNPIPRHPHILAAASNLLSLCFIIIGGLKFSDLSDGTYADEVAWVAALFLFASVLLSYLAVRNNRTIYEPIDLADWAFISGIISLMISGAIAAFSI